MSVLRRYRVVDSDNKGIDKLVVQVDPIGDYNAEAVIPVGPDGTPVGTTSNPSYFRDATDYTQLMEYDGSGNLIYHGKADPGTATSAAGWQIKQFTYIGSNLTAIQYAGGSVAFVQVWDSRAGYTYS